MLIISIVIVISVALIIGLIIGLSSSPPITTTASTTTFKPTGSIGITLTVTNLGTFKSISQIVKRTVNSTICSSLSSVNFSSFETSVCLNEN